MRLNDSGRAGRPSFTLVELLIVIGIIAILVSLTSAAVYKVLQIGPRTACRTEIGELEGAIQNFQNKFGVDYVPSRIRLVRNMASYGTSPLDVDSRDYMLKLFRNCKAQWSSTGINWSQDPAWNGDSILEGHQCLVFFLGGIQVTTPNNGCVGFSTNPNNPAAPGGDRIPPFFDFKSNRLTTVYAKNPYDTNASHTKTFFSYLDPFPNPDPSVNTPPPNARKPYLYFSHYKTSNGYNRYGATDNVIAHTLPTDPPAFSVDPYAQGLTPAPRYYKGDSFQIISAGPDGIFGPGGQWTSSNPSALGPNGRDDMSNFAPGRLEGGE
jgi:general secretion pathway protein G